MYFFEWNSCVLCPSEGSATGNDQIHVVMHLDGPKIMQLDYLLGDASIHQDKTWNGPCELLPAMPRVLLSHTECVRTLCK